MHGPAAAERGNPFFVEDSSHRPVNMLQSNELGQWPDAAPVEVPSP